LLVLDEPSSGLDPIVRRELLEAVVRSVADEGRTVLFSSHLLDEISRVSDHIAMVVQGRIVLRGPLHRALETHQRLVIRLPHASANPGQLPGIIAVSGGPEEWTVIVDGGLDGFRRALQQAGGEVLEESGATFDEIFHALAAERAGDLPQTTDL
jgi:ABC-2 type transport system ATP-binding protein